MQAVQLRLAAGESRLFIAPSAFVCCTIGDMGCCILVGTWGQSSGSCHYCSVITHDKWTAVPFAEL